MRGDQVAILVVIVEHHFEVFVVMDVLCTSNVLNNSVLVSGILNSDVGKVKDLLRFTEGF